MIEYLFVYGTLIDPFIQQHVFGRVTLGEADVLASYKKETIRLDGGLYPIIRPEVDGRVEGRLLQLSPVELALIDQYEGTDYRRIKVSLVSGRQAWVYVA
jgi:gamma-glutamylcyclotransferase (GGCT)/AIG2-like uncharacterized protein YtfP